MMIYIYHIEALSKEEQSQLLLAADACRLPVGLIGERDIHKTVEECLDSISALDMQTFTPLETIDTEAFMLMHIDDLALDSFLAAMRKYKVYISHKCMVTEKNRTWTIQKLIGDVTEEHALMSVLMTLQKLVSVAKEFDASGYEPFLWLDFQNKLHEAEDLMAHVGKVEIAVEDANHTFERFNNAVMALIQSKKKA